MAKKAAALAGKIGQGSIVKFKGTKEEGAEFKKGDILVLQETGPDDESFYAHRYDTKDEEKPLRDLIYLEEINLSTEEEAEEWKDALPETTEEEQQSPYTHTTPKKAETKPDTKMKKTAKAAPAPKGSIKVPSKAAKPKKEKKAKVAKPKKEKPAPVVLPPIKDTATVKKAIHGKDAVEAIHALEKQEEQTCITLGGVLSVVKREKLYLKVGSGKNAQSYDDSNEGFVAFLEENCRTSYRRAMDLIAIYDHFARIGADMDKVANVGYAKLKLLKDVANGDNYEEWLEKGEDGTVESLRNEVVTARLNAGTNKPTRGNNVGSDKVTKFKFVIFNDQAKLLNAAIKLAVKKMPPAEYKNDTQRDSAAIVFMATEWSQSVD